MQRQRLARRATFPHHPTDPTVTQSPDNHLDITASLVQVVAIFCVRNTKLQDSYARLVPVTKK